MEEGLSSFDSIEALIFFELYLLGKSLSVRKLSSLALLRDNSSYLDIFLKSAVVYLVVSIFFVLVSRREELLSTTA